MVLLFDMELLSLKGQLAILLFLTVIGIIYYSFFKKEAKLKPVESAAFGFIESPNVVVVRIKMEEDDMNFFDEPAEARADFIWKYKEMSSRINGEGPDEVVQGSSTADNIVDAAMSAITGSEEPSDREPEVDERVVYASSDEMEVKTVALEDKKNSQNLSAFDPGTDHRMIEDDEDSFEEIDNLDELLEREGAF